MKETKNEELELLNVFEVEELEDRLEMDLWGFSGVRASDQGATKDVIKF